MKRLSRRALLRGVIGGAAVSVALRSPSAQEVKR